MFLILNVVHLNFKYFVLENETKAETICSSFWSRSG